MSLESKCKNAGLTLVRRAGHWQVRGGKVIVNFYPSRMSIYINGMTKGLRGITEEDVIGFALGEKLPPAPKAKRRPLGKKLEKILRRTNLCAICGQAVAREQASIDHRIPLSRGGSNWENNLQLAHRECNQRKGNEL